MYVYVDQGQVLYFNCAGQVVLRSRLVSSLRRLPYYHQRCCPVDAMSFLGGLFYLCFRQVDVQVEMGGQFKKFRDGNLGGRLDWFFHAFSAFYGDVVRDGTRSLRFAVFAAGDSFLVNINDVTVRARRGQLTRLFRISSVLIRVFGSLLWSVFVQFLSLLRDGTAIRFRSLYDDGGGDRFEVRSKFPTLSVGRFFYARVDAGSNFNRCVIYMDRHRFNYRGKVASINCVHGQSPVGGNQYIFHNLRRVKVRHVLGWCASNSNRARVLCPREFIIRHRARRCVIGPTAGITHVFNRTRGNRGLQYQDCIGPAFLNCTVNLHSRSNRGVAGIAIVCVRCSLPGRLFRNGSFFPVLVSVIVRRDHGRVVH